jgi:hypothetical protein
LGTRWKEQKMQKTQGNLDKMQKNENMLEKILGEGAAT